MEAFFRKQAELHPAMQPRDALKCCYQSAFGAEHLLHDPARARNDLRSDLDSCPVSGDTPLLEALSPDTCRINLAAWKAAGLPESWLAEFFVRSCTPKADGRERFFTYLNAMDSLAAAGKLPFDSQRWQTEKQAYLAEGIRPVHHSDAYRAAERPSYRVIDYRYARLAQLLVRLDLGKRQIIALDGRCASGKTTLAQDMCQIAGASAIHMDDFFLPTALRTAERLKRPGGNIHYERFIADVLPGLQSGRAFHYPRFDCGAMALRGCRSVPEASLYVVEGAYSCHPALGNYMTMRAFSDITPQEQQRRILARNGKAGLETFNARWIPMEEAYITAYGIPEAAHIILPAQARSPGM